MALPAADRVKAVWTGTGTGTISLGGAAPNQPVQAFPSSLNGQIVPYVIIHETANEAEVGYGLYTHSGATLTRLYRYYPTPGGAAVSFSAGTKFVTPTPLAGFVVPNIATTDPTVNDDITSGFLRGMHWINTTTPSVWVCRDHTDGAAQWIRIDSGAGNVGTTGTPLNTQYAQFTNATTIQGRTPAQLVADIQSLLPASTANYRGVGNETMLAAFTALAASAGGLTQVADAGTTITIGAATNATFRRLTSDSSISVVLAAAAPAGTRVRLYRAGGGTMTVTCQAAQAAGNGAGYYVTEDQVTKSTTSFTVSSWIEFICQANTGGDSAEFIIVDGAGLSLPTVVTGQIDFTAAGIRVPNGAAVSGTLTVAAHGGGVYKTSGNCTITPAAGFTVTLLLGGAHTIGAGGTAHSPATGDTVSIVCFSATNGDVKLFKTAAASVINLPTA